MSAAGPSYCLQRPSVSPPNHRSGESLNMTLESSISSDGSTVHADSTQTENIVTLDVAALAGYKAVEERSGVIYISRIPPGMQPAKVRHLLSAFGEVGRVYLQQEDAKRAYLRKKFTTTKKVHYTEGWVEFKDKRIARSVATMLNAQPIGGKKGTRWRDDIWTMKYLPKFKWNMLTEQVAHEAAMHTAKLRVELEQSRKEQSEYLRHVELARVLDKRAEKSRKRKTISQSDSDLETSAAAQSTNALTSEVIPARSAHVKVRRKAHSQHTKQWHKDSEQLQGVLGSVF